MERYHFFASSCHQYGFNNKSLTELMRDESESEGTLATILNVLKRVHAKFFDPVSGLGRVICSLQCSLGFFSEVR